MSDDFIVELYDKSDYDDLWKAENLCHEEPSTLSIFNEVLNDKDTYTLVARVNREFAGSIRMTISDGLPYIWSVEVLPQYRGQGIAQSLIRLCEEKAKSRGAGYVWLHVDTSNPAQCLYFKLGYRVTGFERDFYRDLSHALVMQKELL